MMLFYFHFIVNYSQNRKRKKKVCENTNTKSTPHRMDSHAHRCLRLASDLRILYLLNVLLILMMDLSIVVLAWHFVILWFLKQSINAVAAQVKAGGDRRAAEDAADPSAAYATMMTSAVLSGFAAESMDFRNFGVRSLATTATPRARIMAVLNRVSFPVLMHLIYEYGSSVPVCNNTAASTRASWMGSLTSQIELDFLQRDLRLEGDVPNAILHWRSRLASSKFWTFAIANEPLTKWGLIAHDLLSCVLLYGCLTMLHVAWSGHNDSPQLIVVRDCSPIAHQTQSSDHRDEDPTQVS